MKHISLFSGIGGFDLASEWAGWENVASVEIGDFPNKILEYHFPKALHYRDITKLNYHTVNEEISKRFGRNWRSDGLVLSGGFPCQGFSVAGLRLGTEDDRYLWPEYLRAIDFFKPDWITGENVTGILSMEDKSGIYRDVFAKVGHRKVTRLYPVDYYEAIYTRQAKMLVNSICESLEERGYEVQTFAIPAASVGAPHKRERIWFIAHSTSARTRQQDRESSNERRGGSQNRSESIRQEVGKAGTSRINATSSNDGANAANPRPENMRSERENTIHESEPTANTKRNGSSGCGYGEAGQAPAEGEGKGKKRKRVRAKSQRNGGEGNVADANEPGLPKSRLKSGFKKTDAEFRTEFCSGEIISDSDKLNGDLSGLRAGEVSQQQKTKVFGCDATDADHKHGRSEPSIGSSDGSRSRDKSQREDSIADEHADRPGCGQQHVTEITTESRFSCGRHIEDWSNWPVEPPICSGNDGISERLDVITFSKWRNESIKGAGNALVPQIPFEFFKIIDTISKM